MYVLVQHTVSDYRTFKPVFDDDGQRRERLDCHGGYFLGAGDHPHE
jgi:hypothetical protein